jgi:hypothetical protein
MKYISLESSHWDGSNGISFMSQSTMAKEQYFKMLTSYHLLFLLAVLLNVLKHCSASSDHRNMNHSSLESSHWGELNGGGYMSLGTMDEK